MSSKRWSIALLAGASAFAAVAQAPAPEPAPKEDTLFFLSNAAPLPTFGGPIDILGGAGDVAGSLVKDKPYSARSITQSTQTLADGNRITQRNEARVYRDSQGRTRREQTLGGVGQWQTAGAPVTVITINDPVAGKTYVLDPAARQAREIRPFQLAIAHAAAGLEAVHELAEVAVTVGPQPAPLPPPGRGQVTVVRTQIAGAAGGAGVVTRGVAITNPFAEATEGIYEPAEDLGEQVLEGLLVKGERLTDTIPAGAAGNERAIDIVTERWYSKDIEAIVRHRFFDPRVGETTYELVNVVRGDPSPDLFQVPQGYEIVTELNLGPRVNLQLEPGSPGRRVMEFNVQRVAPGSPAPR